MKTAQHLGAQTHASSAHARGFPRSSALEKQHFIHNLFILPSHTSPAGPRPAVLVTRCFVLEERSEPSRRKTGLA